MLTAGLLLLGGGSAEAHPLNMTRLTVSFPGNAVFDAMLDVDLMLALGGTQAYRELATAPAAERTQRAKEIATVLLQSLRFEFDAAPAPVDFIAATFPDVAPEAYDDAAVLKMTVLHLRGAVPPGAEKFRVATSPMTPVEFPLALTLQVPADNVSMTRWMDLGGQSSRPFSVAGLDTNATNTPATLPQVATAPVADAITPAETSPAPMPEAAVEPGRSAVDRRLLEMDDWQKAVAVRLLTAGEFLRLGFLHIIPRGWDHVLFVLGLFFLGANWRALAWQTTAFTIAHTTTLGLASLGIVRLSPAIVEPLIAFSIAYVALENIVRPRLGPARVAIVFAFGLLHGLGFAGSIAEVQLPRDEFFTALLAFNFGVDFGQLTVLAGAFAVVGWWRRHPSYRRAVVVPCCALIATVASWWTFERIFL